ncbi:hypothetical protein KM043_010847 [Ampulex compressa]|nr:hypothetical protein KM043_010847 [Ampulex compressa]
MASEVLTLMKILGVAGRYNDMLYKIPITTPTQNVLIYFGGDVQDLRENMERHNDSKHYVEWSLENTADILSNHFPRNHVFVVRPSRMHVSKNTVFSCFDNFVKGGDKYGIPTFCSTYNALKHLKELLRNSSEQLKNLNNLESCDIDSVNLTLMGFSKGCVVLNQFLHEFHYYQENPDADTEVNSFMKQIKSIWWLDGGHAGVNNTWITDKNILQSFARLNINAYVHVTPYQVQDDRRPWIRCEQTAFHKILDSIGAPIKQTLHFGDKPRSLLLHFNILKAIGDRMR